MRLRQAGVRRPPVRLAAIWNIWGPTDVRRACMTVEWSLTSETLPDAEQRESGQLLGRYRRYHLCSGGRGHIPGTRTVAPVNVTLDLHHHNAGVPHGAPVGPPASGGAGTV